MEVPANEEIRPTEDLVNEAIRHRRRIGRVTHRVEQPGTQQQGRAQRPVADSGPVCLLRRLRPWAAHKTQPTSASPRLNSVAASATPNRQARPESYAPPSGYGGTTEPAYQLHRIRTRVSGMQLNIPCATAQPRRCRSAPNWNTARPRCVCSRLKTRSRVEVRNAQYGRATEPRQRGLRQGRPRTTRGSRWMPSRRNISSAPRPRRWCCKTRASWLRPSRRCVGHGRL